MELSYCAATVAQQGQTYREQPPHFVFVEDRKTKRKKEEEVVIAKFENPKIE